MLFNLLFLQGTSYEDFDSSCVFQLAHAGQNPLIFGADIAQLAKRYIFIFISHKLSNTKCLHG